MRMAKSMRVNTLCDTSRPGQAAHHDPHVAVTHPAASASAKQQRRSGCALAADLDPPASHDRSRMANVDNTGLLALAGDVHRGVSQVNIGQWQGEHFGYPQPATVHKGDQAGIPAPDPRFGTSQRSRDQGYLRPLLDGTCPLADPSQGDRRGRRSLYC
jgi:hypothetical protein